MIPIQIALSVLIFTLICVLVIDLLVGRQDRRIHTLENELSELEVQQHVHPAGNVVVLKPAEPAEDIATEERGD